jgi:hypothetical protein
VPQRRQVRQAETSGFSLIPAIRHFLASGIAEIPLKDGLLYAQLFAANATL